MSGMPSRVGRHVKASVRSGGQECEGGERAETSSPTRSTPQNTKITSLPLMDEPLAAAYATLWESRVWWKIWTSGSCYNNDIICRNKQVGTGRGRREED